MKNLGILLSGRGSNFVAIADSIAAGRIPDARIAVVISNRSDAPGLETARQRGIDTLAISSKGKPREEHDREVVAALLENKVDLVCLAGFMRLLTPWFVTHWAGRMINIHPALLPLFKGLHTHRRALEAGVKQHGATVHFVSPEMDSGPIIAQESVPVMPTDTEERLAERVLEVEHRIYPQALRLVAEGKATFAPLAGVKDARSSSK